MHDPSRVSVSEIIFCYPAVYARFTSTGRHELFELSVPVLPRLITEMAHSQTGIDIHPVAQIGEYFSIDHGTGIVVGQTAIIGNHVRLYQGVTLGAKSFTLDEEGLPIDLPRHPIIEDYVTIYSAPIHIRTDHYWPRIYQGNICSPIVYLPIPRYLNHVSKKNSRKYDII